MCLQASYHLNLNEHFVANICFDRAENRSSKFFYGWITDTESQINFRGTVRKITGNAVQPRQFTGAQRRPTVARPHPSGESA